jgi:hypothetical protein
MFFQQQRPHQLVEHVDHALATLLPIAAAHQQHKIVTTDMADKIQLAVAHPFENLAGQLDHFIAAAIAIHIVERLEMVEIAITGVKRMLTAQQLVDVFIDRYIARQQGDRVGVARGGNLDFGEFAHQVVAGAHAQILAVVADDETIHQRLAIGMH